MKRIDNKAVINNLKQLGYAGSLDTKSIKVWLKEKFKLRLVIESNSDGFDVLFTTLHKIPKEGPARYTDTKELYYLVSDYSMPDEDNVLINALEDTDFLNWVKENSIKS